MNPIEIRHVTSADVPAVIALVRSMRAEYGLVFGEVSPSDARLQDLPESYTRRIGG